jgi:transmembrane sensor
MEQEYIAHIIISFLDGKASPSEKDELSSWMKESEENRKLFLSFYDTWSLSQSSMFNARKALKRMHRLMRERGLQLEEGEHMSLWRRPWLHIAAVAASLVIVLSTWYVMNKSQVHQDIRAFASSNLAAVGSQKDVRLLFSNQEAMSIDGRIVSVVYQDGQAFVNKKVVRPEKESPYNQLIVPNGKKGLVILDDGSTVWVNSGSRLIYPTRFQGKTREVFVDGEIYLEVAHNASCPFIVKTKEVNVQVTGTKFDVAAYSSKKDVQVVLASGSVNVSLDRTKGSAKHLLPNEMYNLSSSRKASVTSVDASQYISWINDVYICDNKDLNELSKDLSRLCGVDITCLPEVRNLKFTGEFDLQRPIPVLLNYVAEILPVKYEMKSDGSYTISKMR